MEIPKGLANNIVFEMNKIIDKDLNFIQKDGKIIASTDKRRVGTYHEGAKKAALSNDIIVIDWDEQYPGSKKGINIPVKFYEETIGVIGISGDRKQVEKYGEIIKRITEILIKEAYLLKKEERENENEKLFLEKILFDKKYNINESIVISKNLKKLKVRKKFSILLSNINFYEDYNIDKIKEVFNISKKIIKKNNGYLMINQNIITALLIEKDYEEIKNIIEKMKEDTKIIKNIDIKFGVGEICEKIEEIKNSYNEAANALEWSLKNNKILTFYSEMDLELILNNIDEKISKNYLKKIFGKLSKEEILEYKKIFYYYEFYNGSLKKVSEELFMHINTLQYKLNKFFEKTGLDIRKYKDFSKIKIGFMLM